MGGGGQRWGSGGQDPGAADRVSVSIEDNYVSGVGVRKHKRVCERDQPPLTCRKWFVTSAIVLCCAVLCCICRNNER